MNKMYCVIAETKTDEARIVSPILTYQEAYQRFNTQKQDPQITKIAIAELTVAHGSRTVGVEFYGN